MPAEDLQSVFKNGIAPLYYFHGENTRDIDEALALLTEKLFEGADADFDLERFDAQTHEPAVVLMGAQTLPFCFERRLVVVQRLDSWDDAAIGKLTDIFIIDPRIAVADILHLNISIQLLDHLAHVIEARLAAINTDEAGRTIPFIRFVDQM